MSRGIHYYLFAAALTSALLCSSRADDAVNVPEPLKAWKSAAYTQRYFIKVDAPGEAGSAGLHPEGSLACVTLPLKMIGEGAALRPEYIALFSEDGALQRVLIRQIKGGSETEIAFTTFPGQRRFCLYTGAVGKTPDLISPMQPRAISGDPRRGGELLVKLRGVAAPATFAYTPVTPLTLKRFQEMEEATAGSPLASGKPMASGEPRPDRQANIDDPECPFFGITYDIFDRIKYVANPLNYCALYEGFLRCPVSGNYKFAIDTPGAAHLVIDGVPVIGADRPDENREAFALNNTVKLEEGVHRVVVHFAEAHPEPGKSNADTRRFGLRLHWQPPFTSGLMCIPPLAFVADLPGVIELGEKAPGSPDPFIHVEVLGHVRAAAHEGDSIARELILISARATALEATQRLAITAKDYALKGEAGQKRVCAWIPAGTVHFRLEATNSDPTKIINQPAPPPLRELLWPTLKTGLKDAMEREVMDLEAELLVKSAPAFLYPNESGHIHAESVLSPKPVIIHKTRFDTKYILDSRNQENIPGWEMLPPFPRPLGEFKLVSQIGSATPEIADVTPDISGRKKKLVSFDAGTLGAAALSKTVPITLKLVAGGVEVQSHLFRLLHANTPKYPGTLSVESGELMFRAEGAASPSERAVILVPEEDEASFRLKTTLDMFSGGPSSSDVLFIGDPLVEGVTPEAGKPIGLAARLQAALPAKKFTSINVPGPHRSRPILNMLSQVCALAAASPDGKLPKQAVVCLGSGDVSRQTPLHTFERALDTLLSRLSVGGVEHVVVVGILPEPWREKQAEPYQERVKTAVRHHHASGVDVFNLWVSEKNWTRHFTADGAENNPVTQATPNAAALEELSKLIQNRMK